MKAFLVLLVLSSFNVRAENFITGGFGIDGATNQAMPSETSDKDAEDIYNSLNLSGMKKVIALPDQSDFFCRIDDCMFFLRASQKGKVEGKGGLAATVTFSGKLADKIFEALKDSTLQVGSRTPVKKVANLTCSKPVVGSATCTIIRTHAVQLKK